MKSTIKLEPLLKTRKVILASMKDQDEGMMNGLNGLDGKELTMMVGEPMKSVNATLNRTGQRSYAEALKGIDSEIT